MSDRFDAILRVAKELGDDDEFNKRIALLVQSGQKDEVFRLGFGYLLNRGMSIEDSCMALNFWAAGMRYGVGMVSV